MHDLTKHPQQRRFRTAGVYAVAILVFAAMSACSATGDIDNTPAPVVLIVGTITQTSTPFGDILTSGGTIPGDTIEVQFTGRLKSSADVSPTGPPLQEIIVERYAVTFARIDGGAAVPAGFQRGMNARVRITPNNSQSDIFTNVSLVVVPSTSKSQPPIAHLISPGFEPDTGFVNIQVNATIRFFGRTVAGDAISAQATIGINFADFGDSNS